MSTVRRLAAVAALSILCVGPLLGQDDFEYAELPVSTWSAPPFWTPSEGRDENVTKIPPGGQELQVRPMGVLPSPPLPLTAINPCRIVDTRLANGPFGGPALVANATRTFAIPSGPCPGIPSDAGAYSLNFTVIGGPGVFTNAFLTAWPTGDSQPTVSTLNFNANQLESNAAVVPAGTSGAINVFVNAPGHLVIDINGYYRAVPVVNTVNSLSGAVTLAPGTGVSITPGGNTLTIGTDATSSNTPNTIVRRDGTGSFTAATIGLSGNITLPATSSTAGNIVQGATRILHTFGTNNLFVGAGAGNYTMTGSGQNTGIGTFALASNESGVGNTAVGMSALSNTTTGAINTAVGLQALTTNEGGALNTAVGAFALFNSSGGSGNIALGHNAGGSLTTGQDNIAIGNSGVAVESGTIRIGTGGTQTRAFLAGVRGVTTGAADGLPVLVDSNGQLGTISSSASMKRQIADVGEASASLLELRPVSFLYRNDTEGIRQYGLIAEEVARVMPELVQFSETGAAETVRYHFLAPLLLNELQREQRRNEEQESRIGKLLARLDALEARVAECEAPTK
jgi:Chaperone of endosialidase